MKSEKLENPLSDSFIRIQLKEIYEFVNYSQRKQLQKIAFRKNIIDVDPYLIHIDLVKKLRDSYELFTPLLTQYILQQVPIKLPVKEAKLFNLLKENLGKTVAKEDIFATIWGNGQYDVSDWTLNALIYRLRKNLSFIERGFVIENYKKIGYMMMKV